MPKALRLDMSDEDWDWIDEWRGKFLIPPTRAAAARHIFALGLAEHKARIEAGEITTPLGTVNREKKR